MNKNVLLALSCLLAISSILCLAMMSVADVSPARAKEMGIEVQAAACGPDQVHVDLSFKTEGALKEYVRVQLEIKEGTKLLAIATLKEDPYRSKQGLLVFGCTVDRSLLEKTSLMIVTGRVMKMVGYEVRVKDFVPADLLRKGKAAEELRKTARPTEKAFKGMELYSWQEPNGHWRFALLHGSNRQKTEALVKQKENRISTVKELEKRFFGLAEGEQVDWLHRGQKGFVYADAKTVAEVVEAAKKAKVNLIRPFGESPFTSSAEWSNDNSEKAIAATAAKGAEAAAKDIAAGVFRIFYFGIPWSSGKPLVDDQTGFRVQIVAGCDVSQPFVAEVDAYNRVMRDWHTRNKSGKTPVPDSKR